MVNIQKRTITVSAKSPVIPWTDFNFLLWINMQKWTFFVATLTCTVINSHFYSTTSVTQSASQTHSSHQAAGARLTKSNRQSTCWLACMIASNDVLSNDANFTSPITQLVVYFTLHTAKYDWQLLTLWKSVDFCQSVVVPNTSFPRVLSQMSWSYNTMFDDSVCPSFWMW